MLVPTAKVFLPLLQAPDSTRYLAAYGGRGSAKSHFFAEHLILKVWSEHIDAVCIREVQRTLSQSVKKLLEEKIIALGLSNDFIIQINCIKRKGGGIIIFQGMQSHNADSIKSLQGFKVAWCEEAQSLSQRTLDLLRPTIRAENSQIWFSWNPESADDAVDMFFRQDDNYKNAVVVKVNYTDNPWFPDVLKEEMLYDKVRNFDKYKYIWLGEYNICKDGVLFSEEDLLVLGKPLQLKSCEGVFAVIDSAVKTGKKNDGTAVIYFAESKYSTVKLTIVDYDKVQLDGALLEHWLPSVFKNLDALASRFCARYGARAGVFIEDKASGSILLQQCKHKKELQHYKATAISNKLTALGKSERAIKATSAVYSHKVKIEESAYNKLITYKGVKKNHLLSELTTFTVSETSTVDDLLDCFTYGVLLSQS